MREYKCLICGYSRKGQYAHNAMILHVKKHTDKHGNKIKQPVEGKHYIKIADSASHPAGKFTHKYECLFEGCDAVYGGENKKQTLQAIKTHIQRGHKSPAIEGENFKKSRKKPNRIAGAVHKKVKEQIKRARRKDSSEEQFADSAPQILGTQGQPQIQSDGIIISVLVKIPLNFGLPVILQPEE